MSAAAALKPRCGGAWGRAIWRNGHRQDLPQVAPRPQSNGLKRTGSSYPSNPLRPSARFRLSSSPVGQANAAASSLSFALERGLRSGKPSDGNPEGRAGNVREARPLEKADRGRIARMLAADAKLDVRPGRFATGARNFDEFANPFFVDRREGIAGKYLLGCIIGKKSSRVIAGESKAGLGQIVAAKGEKLGRLGNLASAQARARRFDHRANRVGNGLAGLCEHRLRRRINEPPDQVELGLRDDERGHDLRVHRRAGLSLGGDGPLENGAGLHLGDLGKGNRDPAAAKTEHRVELLQFGRALGKSFG